MQLPTKVCLQCKAEEKVTLSHIIKKGYWLCSPKIREGQCQLFSSTLLTVWVNQS